MTMRKNYLLVFIFFITSTTLLISQNQIKQRNADTPKQAAQDSTSVVLDSRIVAPESLNESIASLLDRKSVV